MTVDHSISLLVLAMGAFLVPLLSERMRLPAAVGEILFGILVSPQALGLLHPTALTSFLAEFGFAFLMFLVGMEIDFNRIARMGPGGVAIAFITSVLILLGGGVVASLYDRPLFLSIALSAISAGLLLVTLKSMKLSQSVVGQVLLLVGSIGEFVTIIALTAGDLAMLHGMGSELALGLVKLVVVFLIAGGFLAVLRTLVWWFPDSFSRVVISHDASEIGVRASFALMLGLIAVASALGVEAILGAFLAGALFSFVFRDKQAIEVKLSSMGFGFFIPIFFMDVGVNLELAGLLSREVWVDIGFLMVGSLAAKLLPMPLLLLLGLKLRAAIASGLLLAAPLSILVAISRIGFSLGVIDATMADALVLFAVFGGILFPAAFRVVLGKT